MRKIATSIFAWFFCLSSALAQTGVGQLPAWNVAGNPTASIGVPIPATVSAMMVGGLGCSTNPSVPLFTTSFACAATLPTAVIPTIPFSLFAQGTAFSVLCNPTNATANFQACTPTQVQANILCAPAVSVFITGTAATYTTPTCNSILPLYLEVEGIGGGGGGAGGGTGGGAGTAGNVTTVVCGATTLTGNGGGAGANSTTASPGGAGGTATNGDDNITGGTGGAGPGNTAANHIATAGANGFYGGGGGGGAEAAQAGAAGAANSGAGGGAGATTAAVAGASAGGAGGFFRKMFTSPPATCTYTVAAAVSGGSSGTSGGGGGGGAAGRVRVVARWQ